MASVAYGQFVYGLRDLKVTNIGGTVQEDMNAGQTLELSMEYDNAEFHGDDALKSVVSFITHATGTIAAGAISSAALAIMVGKSLSTSGSSPNEVTTLQIDAGDRMPWFKVYGKSLDAADGDAHLLVNKCKIVGGLTLTFARGEILMSEVEVIAVDDDSNGIFQFIQNETAATLPSS